MYKVTEKSLYLTRISIVLVVISAALISFRFACHASHFLEESRDDIPFIVPTRNGSDVSKQEQPPSVHKYLLADDVVKKKKKSSLEFWVLDHLKWHDIQLNDISSSRILVWRARRFAGIGDQIQAMMAAYQYAVLSRRLLRIDWTFPHPLSSVMSEEARDRFVYDGGIYEIHEALKSQPKWSYQFRGSGLSREMFEYLNSDADMVILSIGPAVQTGDDAVNGLRPGDETIPKWTPVAARAALQKVLEPSRELKLLIEKTQRELGLCSVNVRCEGSRNRYVAVHARLGIGTNETALERFAGMETKLTSTASCFAQAVKTYTQVSPLVVFVASDTSSWSRIFEAEMKKTSPTARIVYLNDEPVHINSISRRYGRTIYVRQHLENLLIGEAEHTLALRSGFPEVGFWRGSGKIYTMLRKMACAQGMPAIRFNGTWMKVW